MMALVALPSLRRSSRMVQRSLLVYKHGWMVIFSGFLPRTARNCRDSGSEKTINKAMTNGIAPPK